jgi:hypothetical protein
MSASKLLCVFLVVDSNLRQGVLIDKLWARTKDAQPHFDGDLLAVVAIAFITWTLRQSGAPTEDDVQLALEQEEKRRRRGVDGVAGYINYNVKHINEIDNWIHIPDTDELQRGLVAANWCAQLIGSEASGINIRDLCARHGTQIPSHYLRVGPQLGELLVKDYTQIAQVRLLSERNRSRDIIPRFPPASTVHRFIRQELPEARVKGAAAASNKNVLFELPKGTPEVSVDKRKFGRDGNAFNPLMIFKHLKFAQHLQSTESVKVALNDAIELAFGSDEETAAAAKLKASRTGKLHRSNIQRSRLRLDSTTNNIDRRWFADLAENHSDQVTSMHLFSDGSPVTGHELQGMVLQICHLWEPYLTTLVMPGVMLHYSGTSLASKLYAFMWSLYLMVGTSIPVLEWVCSKIRSVTTDMGTEIGLVDCPNIVSAFLLWLTGISLDVVAGAVDKSVKMFKKALKIPGWSHLLSNAMVYACKCLSDWPAVLEKVRCLCRFFRNGSWRETLVNKLSRVFPGVKALLKSFGARIAKWRYDTVPRAFKAILRLRELCQNHLRNLADFSQRSLMGNYSSSVSMLFGVISFGH